MTKRGASGQKIGDGPVEAKFATMMNAIASVLDKTLNGARRGHAREIGFVLLVFPFGAEPGRCNYISNADRDDVVTLLKEQVARFEGQPETEGHA
jgi:hypothetical protein